MTEPIPPRRRFLLAAGSVTAAALLPACATPRQPLFPAAPGMVSYTFREQFARDIPGTLDTIRALGITDMEFSNLFGATPAGLRALLDARGMRCSSYGVGFADALATPDKVAATAHTLGARFVRVAWLPERQPFTPALAEQSAADLNRIGQALHDAGLTFCYHNHGFEYVAHGDGTLYDLMMARTDPRYVSIELDLLWSFHGGQDPARQIERYGSRVKLVHLKDLRKGVKGNLSGGTDVNNDVALGTGQLDLPAILRAARKAGVEHYYIEDESPHIATQVPQSLRYLRSLTL